MAEKNENTATTATREIVTTRMMDAPRAQVYKAWTEPAHLALWWGPNGFTNTFHKFELRPGGEWDFDMIGPDGKVYPNTSIFEEIVPNERLVFMHVVKPEFRVVATFEDEGEKTRLTFRMQFDDDKVYEAVKPMVVPANEENFDRLEAELARMGNTPPLVITRTFNAPLALVWKMHTEAEHLARWWGPKGSTVDVKTFELRPGGVFHYKLQTPDNRTMWGKFVYREIIPATKLVYTSAFSDADGNLAPAPFPGLAYPLEVMNVLAFSVQDGKTTLTLTGSPYNANEEERNSFTAITSGMQDGFHGMYDGLDEYLATL